MNHGTRRNTGAVEAIARGLRELDEMPRDGTAWQQSYRRYPLHRLLHSRSSLLPLGRLLPTTERRGHLEIVK